LEWDFMRDLNLLLTPTGVVNLSKYLLQ